MKLSEWLRDNRRPQAFGALTRGDAACAVAQIFEEAFGIPTDRVGIRRESQLIRWIVQIYRIDIPARTESCGKCAMRVRLPDDGVTWVDRKGGVEALYISYGSQATKAGLPPIKRKRTPVVQADQMRPTTRRCTKRPLAVARR